MEKFIFHLTSTSFLGYIISDKGFSMDPDKLKEVVDWPQPTSLKAIQWFLGFANYRKFIRNFSATVSPITALTKKDADTSSWSSEACQAFETLKKALSLLLSYAILTLNFLSRWR
ncbi:uncharacterized protein LOC142462862 [Ascaphus truei]|uniref:uncharacterized protein LOC142462862 n=1 Tax=Ascaphus truei TaxID=8439 RepID=UPI003F5A7331